MLVMGVAHAHARAVHCPVHTYKVDRQVHALAYAARFPTSAIYVKINGTMYHTLAFIIDIHSWTAHM